MKSRTIRNGRWIGRAALQILIAILIAIAVTAAIVYYIVGHAPAGGAINMTTGVSTTTTSTTTSAANITTSTTTTPSASTTTNTTSSTTTTITSTSTTTSTTTSAASTTTTTSAVTANKTDAIFDQSSNVTASNATNATTTTSAANATNASSNETSTTEVPTTSSNSSALLNKTAMNETSTTTTTVNMTNYVVVSFYVLTYKDEVAHITLNRTLTLELKEILDRLVANSTIKLGSPNASIIVVDYTDLLCPACIWHLANISKFIANGSMLYALYYFPLIEAQYYYFYKQGTILTPQPLIAGVEAWLSLKCVYEKYGANATLDAIMNLSDIAWNHYSMYNKTRLFYYIVTLPSDEKRYLESHYPGCAFNLTLDQALTIVKQANSQMAAEFKALGIYDETLGLFCGFVDGLCVGYLSPQILVIYPVPANRIPAILNWTSTYRMAKNIT